MSGFYKKIIFVFILTAVLWGGVGLEVSRVFALTDINNPYGDPQTPTGSLDTTNNIPIVGNPTSVKVKKVELTPEQVVKEKCGKD